MAGNLRELEQLAASAPAGRSVVQSPWGGEKGGGGNLAGGKSCDAELKSFEASGIAVGMGKKRGTG